MMKRAALLFILLLLLLPALAFADTVLTEIVGEEDEDIAVRLVRREDGTTLFVGENRVGGEWITTLSKPLPEGAELYTEDGLYDTAIIGYYRTDLPDVPWVEQHVTWDGESWRITMTMRNAWEMIAWEEERINSDIYDAYYGVFTLPLDVARADWLKLPVTFREAMALMDTAGYEAVNKSWGPVEDDMTPEIDKALADLAGEYLPGCTVESGRLFENTAMLLLRDEENLLRFAGAVRTGDGWDVTLSTPLPEGARCNSEYRMSDGWAEITVPLSREKARVRLGIEQIYVQVAEFEGAWRITGLNFVDDVLGVGDFGYETEYGVALYGALPYSRDIREVDWTALPGSAQQAIDGLDRSAWRVLAESVETAQGLTLYANVEVRIISQNDGVAQVEIAHSGMTVQLPASYLTAAAPHYDWDSWDGEAPLDFLNREAPITLLDAPGGAPLLKTDGVLTVLGHAPAIWLLVMDGDTGTAGFIPMQSDDPLAMAAALCPQYTFLNGAAGENACIFLMQRPDGETVLTGFTRENGAWRMRESEPLPDTAYLEEVYGSGENIVLNIEPDGCTPEYPLRLTAGWNGGTWLISALHRTMDEEAVHLMENGLYVNCAGTLYGSIDLERDVFRVDWSSFPQRAAEMYACLQDDWGVVRHQSAPLCESADGSIYRTYLLGTPVQIISDDGDWLHVAVFGGSERGYMPRSAVAVGQEQASEGLGVWRSGVETLPWQAPTLETASGTPLYGAMGGEKSAETEEPQCWQVLCDLGDGWYHVLDETDGLAWYVQTDTPIVWPERDAQ